MRERIPRLNIDAFPRVRLVPFTALRETLHRGYGMKELRADLLAGLVVGVVALPLSMALAIAAGVAPQHGLYTAIVAGAMTALTGGSRVNVSGPTAAFVVVLAPISAHYGLGGLLLATALAGCILLILGFARLGRLITFIPHPVTSGFTAGIAVVIAVLQLRDFLGLQITSLPSSMPDRLRVLVAAAPTLRFEDLAVGCTALAVLLVWPHVSRKVPAPLVALVLAAVLVRVLAVLLPGFDVETIASRFTAIPRVPPLPALPWHFADANGEPLVLSLTLVRELLPAAFTIAMLGAIESLLCAVVADGMTATQHDPDAELVGQGFGNLTAAFFGGIPATGAIARTATNIRAGAVSPLAAFFHSGIVLLAMLALAPLLGQLPMAALAAILLLVAWNMSEVRHFVSMLKIAPRSDVLVMLTCFGLTVIFDMVFAVTVGVVLAALLFMRRMASVSALRLVNAASVPEGLVLPEGTCLYEIAGPLFFGAAQKAMSTLHRVAPEVRHVLLDMRGVPVMDATGLVNFESALLRLTSAGVAVTLVGVQSQPRQVLQRAGVLEQSTTLRICDDLEEAVAVRPAAL